MPQQILRVRRQADRFRPPIRQPVQRPDPQPPKPRRVSPLRRFQPPIEIPLRPRRVHFRVNLPIVRLLVNHQPFRPRRHQRPVFLRFHRANLQRNRRRLLMQRRDALLQVSAPHEFRMLPRHQQNVRKPCSCNARASRATSSTLNVTRTIGLSRENPQYLQLLTHSFER